MNWMRLGKIYTLYITMLMLSLFVYPALATSIEKSPLIFTSFEAPVERQIQCLATKAWQDTPNIISKPSIPWVRSDVAYDISFELFTDTTKSAGRDMWLNWTVYANGQIINSDWLHDLGTCAKIGDRMNCTIPNDALKAGENVIEIKMAVSAKASLFKDGSDSTYVRMSDLRISERLVDLDSDGIPDKYDLFKSQNNIQFTGLAIIGAFPIISAISINRKKSD